VSPCTAPDAPFEPLVRLLQASDLDQPFEGAGLLAGRITIETWAAFHRPTNGKVVLVADFEGVVVGAIALARRPDGLHVEYLSTNGAIERIRGLRIRMPLLRAAEALAGVQGAQAMTLGAVSDPSVIAFYKNAGFMESGPPFDETGWGVLHPMWKPLPPPP
jgi:GNAT superfamily N-acetyltransferase